jgi:hypothetical protein
MAMSDWADDDAVEFLNYLFRCNSDEQRLTLLAAKFRVIKQVGIGEGFKDASKTVDEVFARHA